MKPLKLMDPGFHYSNTVKRQLDSFPQKYTVVANT